MLRARAGLKDPRRPIGSFIVLGPTGVGKTETGRALAQFLFDDEQALTRIDMSSIVFFVGILLAVACLEHARVLELVAKWLDATVGRLDIIVILLVTALTGSFIGSQIFAFAQETYGHIATGF